MIDTDKYEGHTPGPWEWFLERIIQADEGWVPIAIMDSTEEDYKKEDARLIADAPLLLEAYKRLVIVADELYLHIVGEPHMTLDELVAEMPWRNEE